MALSSFLEPLNDYLARSRTAGDDLYFSYCNRYAQICIIGQEI